MFRETLLVAGKDLRIERRAKVALGQIIPFSLTIFVLFGFALDPDSGVLKTAAAGLFWVAVLLSTVLIVQRSFVFEFADGGRDGLRLSGLDAGAIFAGKAIAIAVQLLALEVVLAVGALILFNVSFNGVLMLVLTCVCATIGLAAAGTIYGALATGVRARETLLPLLFLPIVAPVLLSAARASEAALNGFTSDGWPWLQLLAVFAVLYAAIGTVAFGPLLEDS